MNYVVSSALASKSEPEPRDHAEGRFLKRLRYHAKKRFLQIVRSHERGWTIWSVALDRPYPVFGPATLDEVEQALRLPPLKSKRQLSDAEIDRFIYEASLARVFARFDVLTRPAGQPGAPE